MQRLLCTIGFAGKTAEEFFTLLSDAGVQQVIDIRQHSTGQLSGFAKHPDLSFFLKKIARIEYLHEPLLASAPEPLKTYRRTKDWPFYEADFLAALRERGVPGAWIHLRGLPKWRFFAPNPVQRNAIAGSLLTCSRPSGASKATPSKFATSYHLAKGR